MAKFSNEELFSHVKDYHSHEPWNDIIETVDQSQIALTLRPYQVNAVKWMIYREKNQMNVQQNINSVQISPPKGGILADEMGLGKTIEVLCCVLNNPCEEEIKYSLIHKIRTQESTQSPNCSYGSSSEDEILPVKNRKRKPSNSPEDEINSDYEGSSSSTLTKQIVKRNKTNEVDITIEEVIKTYSSPLMRHPTLSRYSSLVAWYENALGEVKASSKTRRNEEKLQCVCVGSDTDQICCLMCKTWQHRECVGLNGYQVDEYYCPQCWSQREKISSRATFIITPASISSQWETEIQKHITVPDFKVLVYNGVKGNSYVQPEVLAQYDIVITTYTVLCSELYYTDTGKSERKLRNAKKYFSFASPLTCVRWWRICLDEAQMVESFQSNTAVMAKKLSGVHLWAVTGTPIQKTYNDLFGLVQFLKIEPFNDTCAWSELAENKEEFFKFLSIIMWRNSKKDVLAMLGVPPQSIIHHWLRFSPVESYFYQRTHNECAYHMRLKLCRFDDLNTSLKELSRETVNRILIPLLRLRQACIHPQAVRGKYLHFKHTMTMAELLGDMVTKAKNDVEISLRQYVSSINGLAAIHIINFDWEEAVNSYRKVLQLGQEKDAVTKVDTLQMIHTLHNLAEVLESHSAGIPPTLRDSSLREEAIALEQSYVKKYENAVESAKQMTAKLGSSISQQSRGATLGFSSWWENVLDWVDDPNELLYRVSVHLEDHKINKQNSLQSKLRNIPSVHREIALWLANADSARMDTLQALRRLEALPITELADKALSCHLTQNKKKKRRNCALCQCETVLHRYETSIFAIDNKHIFEGSDDDGESSESESRSLTDLKNVNIIKHKKEGSWKPTQMEQVLQAVAQYARVKRAPTDWLEDASKHLALLNTVRKEFKWLRTFWSLLSEQVQASDEIGMAKIRLRLPLPGEEEDLRKKKIQDRHLILPHEVGHQFAKLEHESIVSDATYKKNSGILLYLQNLQKEDKSEVDPCPVCRDPLNEKWSVLHCGHCFCFVCIRTMLQMGSSLNIECAVCRVKTPKNNVSYVVSRKSKEEAKNYNIKGSFSTKIEAVVAQLLELKEKEPTVKVLIFSAWEKVLDVIQEALEINSISFRRYGSGLKNKTGLAQFKSSGVTALLLPLRFGAKGLNLVEATHVFLVEPILNPAEELQALGRVHRIGQTRETYVHRFVIRSTIEERIMTSLEAAGDSDWSSDNLTLQTLFNFFSVVKDEPDGVVVIAD